jgi:hypothetical protein
MRRRCLIVVIATGALIGASMAAGEEHPYGVPRPEILQITPEFQVGDAIDLELVKGRVLMRAGQTATSGESITPVRIEVRERGANGAVLRFAFGTTSMPDAPPGVGQLIEKLMGGGMDLDVEYDAAWQSAHLRNWDEVRGLMLEAVENAFNSPLLKDKSAEEKGRLRAILMPLFERREIGEPVLLKEVQIYCHILGWTLQRKGVGESDVPLSNPLGGDPLPARQSIELVEYDEGRRARVIINQTVDKEKAGAAIAMITKKLVGSDTAIPSGGELSVGIQDHFEYVVDLKSGWPTDVKMERAIVYGDRQRTDTLHWRAPNKATR